MNEEIKIKTLGQLLDYVETEEKGKKLINYITNLQEKNKDLKEKVDQYENPDDYTLFYMWLDTRAKDKMKQMEHEVTSLKQRNAMITKLSESIKEENQKLRKKIKYMEMIMEYKNELRQPQDESEIHNELYR